MRAPNLKEEIVCICPIRDAAMKAREAMGGLVFLSTGFASATAALLRLEKELAQQGRMIECKTHALNTLLDIDYSEVEKRITALLSSKTRLSNDEFYSILQPLPPMQSGRTAEDYKRKPWLKLQDDYDRQKSRRNGRPKKGR